MHRAYSICTTEYLLKKDLLLPEEKIISRNIYPCWVIKQIWIQVEKQLARISINSSNNDNINTSVENSFTNENNSEMSEKQLSFITWPYKGKQSEKVVKSFKIMLHNRSLWNNIETKVLYTWTKLGFNLEIKTKQSSTINMI